MIIINPLLAEMSTDDLQRRYSGTYVKYNEEIAWVNDIDRGYIWTTAKKGMRKQPFKPSLLDVSRPAPRWVQCGRAPVYISYIPDRQWHRGFCGQNTKLRNPHNGRYVFPSVMLLDIFEEFYKPSQVIHCKMKDLDKELVILSPQILIFKKWVFFRELSIGVLGSIKSQFVQELKELVGDYENENNPDNVSNKSSPFKQAGRKEDIEGHIAPNWLGRAAQQAIRGNVNQGQFAEVIGEFAGFAQQIRPAP